MSQQAQIGQPSEDSIRVFRNDFLESLTHCHPIVPLLFWSPVVLVLLWRAVVIQGLAPGQLALVAGAALLTWTFAEYVLHRFVFHYPARSTAGRWLVFLFHGIHHDAPRDKTRLVMPPAGGVLIMGVLWLLFALVIPQPWLDPFVAFFIVGYLIYDYIHYATHHFPMRNPVARYLKRYHMQHHFSSEGGRYGVSSPLWDLVFRTKPR